LGRGNAWIGHVSYANVAGIATFDGRIVVGWAQTAAERRRRHPAKANRDGEGDDLAPSVLQPTEPP
jgi:hypothetical protein